MTHTKGDFVSAYIKFLSGLFTEIHEDPDNAPSDGPCMLELASLDDFLKQVTAIDKITKSL